MHFRRNRLSGIPGIIKNMEQNCKTSIVDGVLRLAEKGQNLPSLSFSLDTVSPSLRPVAVMSVLPYLSPDRIVLPCTGIRPACPTLCWPSCATQNEAEPAVALVLVVLMEIEFMTQQPAIARISYNATSQSG